MEQSIASLSPDQAQHALIIFYDLLPDELWEGGKKPSAAELEFTAEQVQEGASENARPVVNALLAEGSEEGKGETAKAVLDMFHSQELVRGFVEQAIQQARQPHLAPIPLIIGAVIVILAVVPKEIKGKDWRIKWWDPKALVDSLSTFVEKLPADAWKALTPRAPGGDYDDSARNRTKISN